MDLIFPSQVQYGKIDLELISMQNIDLPNPSLKVHKL